jgi:hypothetical protein
VKNSERDAELCLVGAACRNDVMDWVPAGA